MQRGIWGRFGWLLLVLAAVGGALIWLKEVITGKSDDDEDDAKERTDTP
jgi:hypothetical protein